MKVKRIAENGSGFTKGQICDAEETIEGYYKVENSEEIEKYYKKETFHLFFEIIEQSEDERFRDALINIHK